MPTVYFLVFRWFPKRWFSRLMGRVANTRWPGWLLGAGIALYRAFFRIEMADFEVPPGGFSTFNAFFTRAVKPAARPIGGDAAALVSPVDGTVLSLETAREGRLIQAKGKDYTLSELLGEGWEQYDGGQALTVYLSPRDYHRIHSPCAGSVVRLAYTPGDLWTVGALGVRGVPRLFSRNERVVSTIDAPGGRVALVAVGATVVGGIRVVYDALVTNRSSARAFSRALQPAFAVLPGMEVGRFEIGSTVILLTRPGEAGFDALPPGRDVRMGEAIGRFGQPAPV